MMYSPLVGAVLAVLALAPAAASPVDVRDTNFPRTVTQHFHIKGNNTGLTKVDGVLLGSRPLDNTYTGFDLPYGQVPRLFGYDPKSAYLYAGTNGAGDDLILGAFAKPDGTAAVKAALKDEAGQSPIECAIIIGTLLCGVNVNGVLYHDLIVKDYKKDGNYELGIGPSGSGQTIVELVIDRS